MANSNSIPTTPQAPLSSTTATAQAAARYRARVAARHDRRAKRHERQRAAAIRNRNMAADRLNILTASAADGSPVAAHLLEARS